MSWHEERKGLLTASNFAAALGISPYKSRQQLWRELTGRVEPFQGNEYTAWGTEHEQDAIFAYECKTGNVVEATGLTRHPLIDWMGATPDGLVGVDGAIECKCPRELHSQVPEHYLPQVMGVMECIGAEYCDYISWTPYETRVWRVSFCKNYRDSMIEELARFWEHIQIDSEPPRRKRFTHSTPQIKELI